MTTQLGKDYVSYFEKNGLPLNLEKTEGLDAGLVLLNDLSSKINASFVTAGTATRQTYPNLLSLGSVEISPLWLFYRGDTITAEDPFEYYLKKSIAVGGEGTVTNKIFNLLMALNNPHAIGQTNFLKLSHVDAAQKLRSGDIDAMFIVNGHSSEVVQSLLNDPNIKLMNFPLADAYTKKLPFLKKVVIPKASMDIEKIRPSRDITLLASSVNLLIQNDVHPTIQWALLLAAKETNLKNNHFFSDEATYPQYIDKSFPLSPVAQRFYTNGAPAFLEYLPLWLGAIVENIWVVLLGVFVFGLPIFNFLLNIRTFASQKLLWKHFWELRYLEDLLHHSNSKETTVRIIAKLSSLDV
ncbi:MAG: TAXI family TRAP transporter solute-binding subunit, partial [Fluviibacter sp.]